MTQKKSALSCAKNWGALVASIVAGTSGLHAKAQETSSAASLPETVVTANRLESELDATGSSIDVIRRDDLEEKGSRSLLDALDQSPGVIATSTAGQRGQTGSLFIRGFNTNQTQLRVDGIRISDSTIQLGNFLGQSNLVGIESIDILKGPQSALYGGESIGGVVALHTGHGEAGEFKNQLFAEAGSFGTLNSRFRTQGGVDKFTYFFEGSYETTENDPASGNRQDFQLYSAATRFEYALNSQTKIGLTARMGDGRFNQKNSFGANVIDTDTQLVTAYLDAEINEFWHSTLRVGLYDERYDFGRPSTFGSDLRKKSVEWENVLTWNDEHQTSLGASYEDTDFEQALAKSGNRGQYGLYANHQWAVLPQLTVNLGGRFESYDDFDDIFTYRGTVAYHVEKTDTIFRASYGKAYRSPSILELNGSPTEAGNPDLDAETSYGWEIGAEQKTDIGTLRVTYFENDIEDAILDPFGEPGRNLPGKSKSNGIEVGLDGKLICEQLHYRVAYTWLENSPGGIIPQQTASADLAWHQDDQWLVGLGTSYIDARSYGGDPLADYTLLRAYAQWQIHENLRLNLRVENLLNEDYLLFDSFGTQTVGAGTGAYAGLTFNW